MRTPKVGLLDPVDRGLGRLDAAPSLATRRVDRRRDQEVQILAQAVEVDVHLGQTCATPKHEILSGARHVLKDEGAEVVLLDQAGSKPGLRRGQLDRLPEQGRIFVWEEIRFLRYGHSKPRPIAGPPCRASVVWESTGSGWL